MYCKKAILLSVLLFCFNVSSQQYKHPSEIKYPDFEYKLPNPSDYRYTLNNGIVVYIVEDSSLPVLDITALIKTGSIYEPRCLAGLAGITARLMRTGGTVKYSGDEMDEKVEFLAAQLGCSMSINSASASLSILKKYTDTGLDLFSEMLLYPKFSQKKLTVEKKRAYEYIKHRLDNPRNVLSYGFSKLYYKDFPAGVSPEMKSIKRISRKDIVKFYKHNFRPENMMFAVSGDFKKEEMLKKLNNIFGNLRVDKIKTEKMPKWDKKTPKGKVYFIDQDVNQAFIKMGHPCIKRPSKDYYALSVLNYIFGGGGFTSRLTKKVRSDEGLVYDIRSYVEPNYFFPGTFSISLQTKSKSSAYAIKLCMEELKRIIDNPVTKQELGDAKKSLTESLPGMFRTPKDVAETFCISEYWGRSLDHFDVYSDKIKALTVSDLHRVARKYLHPESLTVVIVGSYESCVSGDGRHSSKLSDFGKIVRIDVSKLEEYHP